MRGRPKGVKDNPLTPRKRDGYKGNKNAAGIGKRKKETKHRDSVYYELRNVCQKKHCGEISTSYLKRTRIKQLWKQLYATIRKPDEDKHRTPHCRIAEKPYHYPDYLLLHPWNIDGRYRKHWAKRFQKLLLSISGKLYSLEEILFRLDDSKPSRAFEEIYSNEFRDPEHISTKTLRDVAKEYLSGLKQCCAHLPGYIRKNKSRLELAEAMGNYNSASHTIKKYLDWITNKFSPAEWDEVVNGYPIWVEETAPSKEACIHITKLVSDVKKRYLVSEAEIDVFLKNKRLTRAFWENVQRLLRNAFDAKPSDSRNKKTEHEIISELKSLGVGVPYDINPETGLLYYHTLRWPKSVPRTFIYTPNNK